MPGLNLRFWETAARKRLWFHLYCYFAPPGDLSVTSSLPRRHQLSSPKTRLIGRLLVSLCLLLLGQKQEPTEQGSAVGIRLCFCEWASLMLYSSPDDSLKVMPPDQPQWGDSRYRGSFQFCFWQQGHWKEVTIDDRLPCIKHSLCFSKCQSPTIFWVALLEKAYAKLVAYGAFSFSFDLFIDQSFSTI